MSGPQLAGTLQISMSYDDRGRTRQPQWESDEAEVPSARPSISPGKRTLTMSLPLRRARGLPPSQAIPPAPVQTKAEDPAAMQMRREEAAFAEQWMNAAIRPDLHDAPMQRKRAGGDERDQASTSLPADGGGKAMPRDVQAKMEGAFGGGFLESAHP